MSFRKLFLNRAKYPTADISICPCPKWIQHRLIYNLFEKDKHLYHPEYPLNVYIYVYWLCAAIGGFTGIYYSINITETKTDISICCTPKIFLGYLLFGMMIGAFSPITIPFLTIKTIYDEYKICE